VSNRRHPCDSSVSLCSISKQKDPKDALISFVAEANEKLLWFKSAEYAMKLTKQEAVRSPTEESVCSQMVEASDEALLEAVGGAEEGASSLPASPARRRKLDRVGVTVQNLRARLAEFGIADAVEVFYEHDEPNGRAINPRRARGSQISLDTVRSVLDGDEGGDPNEQSMLRRTGRLRRSRDSSSKNSDTIFRALSFLPHSEARRSSTTSAATTSFHNVRLRVSEDIGPTTLFRRLGGNPEDPRSVISKTTALRKLQAGRCGLEGEELASFQRVLERSWRLSFTFDQFFDEIVFHATNDVLLSPSEDATSSDSDVSSGSSEILELEVGRTFSRARLDTSSVADDLSFAYPSSPVNKGLNTVAFGNAMAAFMTFGTRRKMAEISPAERLQIRLRKILTNHISKTERNCTFPPGIKHILRLDVKLLWAFVVQCRALLRAGLLPQLSISIRAVRALEKAVQLLKSHESCQGCALNQLAPTQRKSIRRLTKAAPRPLAAPPWRQDTACSERTSCAPSGCAATIPEPATSESKDSMNSQDGAAALRPLVAFCLPASALSPRGKSNVGFTSASCCVPHPPPDPVVDPEIHGAAVAKDAHLTPLCSQLLLAASAASSSEEPLALGSTCRPGEGLSRAPHSEESRSSPTLTKPSVPETHVLLPTPPQFQRQETSHRLHALVLPTGFSAKSNGSPRKRQQRLGHASSSNICARSRYLDDSKTKEQQLLSIVIRSARELHRPV
jgi:hypothetical protein